MKKTGKPNNTVSGPWPERPGVESSDSSPQAQLSKEATQYAERLFDKYHGTLLRYIARFTPNRDDASEILQDTYLRILQQQSLDHMQENARAYLFKVATNLMRDKVRRDKSHHYSQHESFNEYTLGEDSGEPPDDPLQNTEYAETLGHIKSALMEVPERTRQVFILHRFLGLSHPEIAKKLGITTRTVERNMKTAMNACKARIRNLL